MMVKKSELKFAIIGCGKISHRHAEQIINKGTLIGVCDIIKEKADLLASEFNAKPFYNLSDLLKTDADIIVICTPNYLHASQTIQCLNSGFHVICEKPMALTVEDCNDMITASEKNNKKLFIVKQNRFNSPVVAVRKLIDEGKLGAIHSVQLNCFWNRNSNYYKDTWRGSKEKDGGILFTQFSHFIDLLYWFMGDVIHACSYSSNFQHKKDIEFEDTGVTILKFANNAIGTLNYTINSFKKNMEGSLTFFGETGTVKIGGEYLNTLEYQCIDGVDEIKIENTNPANNYGFYTGSMSNHDKVYENVFDVFEGNASITASAYDGKKTVEIINLIMSGTKGLHL